ncbi:MAG: ATP-binding protein [Cyanobacteriota bacterium]
MNINQASLISFNAYINNKQVNKSQEKQVLSSGNVAYLPISPNHLRANFIPFLGQGKIEFPVIDSQNYKFEDIGGLKHPKASLLKLKEDILSNQPVGQVNQTYIIQGDSGSGKSALIKALANELKQHSIPVIQASGGEFGIDNSREARGDYNGNGAERLANLFWFAKKEAEKNPNKTAVILIDNIDGLLPIRYKLTASEPTLNLYQIFSMFMTELEKIEKDNNNRIFVIATSSNSTSLDTAAFSKFKTIVNIYKPANKDERIEVLNSIMKRRKFNIQKGAENEIIDRLAHCTGGYYPGKLERILEIASEYAKANNTAITLPAVLAAFLDERDGNIKPIVNNHEFIRVSIAHEIGHALARVVMNRVADRLEKEHNIKWGHSGLLNCINLDPRNDYSASLEVLYNYKNPFSSFEYNFAEMVSNYAAAPSEALFGGLNTNGPEGDQIKTYELAKSAVKNWGMGKSTGKIVSGIDKTSGEWKEKADSDIKLILDSASQTSDEIVDFYKGFILEYSKKYLEFVKHTQAIRENSNSAYPAPNIITDKELLQDIKNWEANIGIDVLKSLEDKIIQRIKDIRPDHQCDKKLFIN